MYCGLISVRVERWHHEFAADAKENHRNYMTSMGALVLWSNAAPLLATFCNSFTVAYWVSATGPNIFLMHKMSGASPNAHPKRTRSGQSCSLASHRSKSYELICILCENTPGIETFCLRIDWQGHHSTLPRYPLLTHVSFTIHRFIFGVLRKILPNVKIEHMPYSRESSCSVICQDDGS